MQRALVKMMLRGLANFSIPFFLLPKPILTEISLWYFKGYFTVAFFITKQNLLGKEEHNNVDQFSVKGEFKLSNENGSY